jgi:Na+/melibiose symporter-like transporter
MYPTILLALLVKYRIRLYMYVWRHCQPRMSLLSFNLIMATNGNGSSSIDFRKRDYFKITLLTFAVTALWQSLHGFILPVRILDFVPDAQKNTYLGLITFTGLILGMLAQPVAGVFSDRAHFKRGRRRPFILLGMTALTLLLFGIGWAPFYVLLFVSYCLMQVASNVAQAPYQAFIPEQVPPGKRGLASGVKNLLEILGGVCFAGISSVLIGHYSIGHDSYWLWLNLGLLGMVLAITTAVTILWVKEQQSDLRIEKTPFWASAFGVFRVDLKRHHAFVLFLASRLLVFAAFTTIQQFALYFFKDVVGVPDPAAASFRFLIVSVVGMLLAAYPSGWLSDRIGRKPIAVSAALLGALAILLILFLPKEENVLLFPASLLGVALAAFSSTNWALATDLVAKGEEARYLGLASMATAGGGALARLIGPVIDFANRGQANLGYTVMLLVCVVYLIAGALILLKVKPSGR